ncbi:17818_t:CDS:2 [Cetraspora pellucida]|uniref:17818_t:CDS:1 n=1 Tax=Cetraspora pellucida TaxID=1433469 RepID=A0A9N9CEV9_9GLOM|nr:17818_t:CDS:2 [Cetraspora pellucida]
MRILMPDIESVLLFMENNNLYAIHTANDNGNIGDLYYLEYSDDGPSTLTHVRLEGILTGGIGNFAFMTTFAKLVRKVE